MLLDRKLEERGWSVVKHVGSDSEVARLVSHLGAMIKAPDRPSKQMLKPILSHEAQPRTYSGRLGMAAFPYHTDCANWTVPPRYVVLRNVGRPTQVGTLVRNLLSEVLRDATLSKLMSGAIFRARARQHSFLCSGLVRRGEDHLLRWDRYAMRPANELARQCHTPNRGDARLAGFWNSG